MTRVLGILLPESRAPELPGLAPPDVSGAHGVQLGIGLLGPTYRGWLAPSVSVPDDAHAVFRQPS